MALKVLRKDKNGFPVFAEVQKGVKKCLPGEHKFREVDVIHHIAARTILYECVYCNEHESVYEEDEYDSYGP